jgi:multicomponent Na+:H+ antiporter subunit D
MLIASFGLASAGGGRRQSGGAVNYVTFNLLASFLFLLSVGLLYRNSGTLNMAGLSLALGGEDPGHAHVLSVLFMIAFGIKAAAFPFFYWLPDSYPNFPIAIIAIFAALLTKVGVYALLRLFTLLFVHDPDFTRHLILFSAGFTMLMGGLGAAYHKEIRMILSFHIVSQIGYALLGLGLFTLMGLGGAIFFLFHNILAKTNLYLVSGIMKKMQGSYALGNLGGVMDRSPSLACLFLIPAFSLAGIPPLSGFVAKFMLIKAGIDSGRYFVTSVALGVSLITMYSMTKIWNEAFLKPAGQRTEPEGSDTQSRFPPGQSALLWGPCLVLAALTVAGGIGAEPFIALARDAAIQLLDRDGYVRAVLGVP